MLFEVKLEELEGKLERRQNRGRPICDGVSPPRIYNGLVCIAAVEMEVEDGSKEKCFHRVRVTSFTNIQVRLLLNQQPRSKQICEIRFTTLVKGYKFPCVLLLTRFPEII